MPKANIIISGLLPSLYSTKRLVEEAKKLKHSVMTLNPYQWSLPVKDKKISGLYFHRTTGTNYDDFDLFVSKYYQLQGMKITNPIEKIVTFRSKDLQFLFFKTNNLPAIPTIVFRGPMTTVLLNDIEQLGGSDEKYVLKMVRGNQGIGVNYLESKKSLLSVLETFGAMKDQRFLIQPYLTHKKEWRVFCLRGEVLAVVEKNLTTNEFRGNAKRSNARVLKKVPVQLKDLALKAFSASGLDYAGMDILQNKNGEFNLLEINAIPGFKQVEELSNINIARELIIKLQ